MLISKEIQIRWNGATRKHYESKGYKWTKQNDWFTCKIEDVQVTSPVKVLVQCDYCDEPHIYEKEYRNHISSMNKNGKDCCGKSKTKRMRETMIEIYGVDNPLKIDKFKEIVSAALRTPFNEVKKYCEDKGLILLSEEKDYKSDRSPLKMICTHHEYLGIQDTNFMKIKKNVGCCAKGGYEGGGDKNRLDGQIVYDAFIKQGLEPQFKPKDYIDNIQQLPYVCIKHRNEGVQYRCYSNLLYTKGCEYCRRESIGNAFRLDQSYVFNEFILKGLIPIEGQTYVNKETLIYYRCINHPNIIQHMYYGNLQRTNQGCDCCRAENSFTGLNRYLRSCIGQWKHDTEEYCNKSCVLTGDSKYDIHHLHSFHIIIEDALSILNMPIKQDIEDYSGEDLTTIRDKVIELHAIHGLGVCLNNRLHTLFHSLYSKNNTSEQFDEFKKRYLDGEFEQLKDIEVKEAI
ncbi:hypothetical protein [Clostridium estertheticum]|uniref:hypothetical protein n=1 Tax=Clostridium estertheticum TaxID=238834 RepID=UPI001C0D6F00|nr:hypothetical protein [Clostridium estertheticum]MBU3186642.1 hypothetical protein [Clostridium estertheticum]